MTWLVIIIDIIFFLTAIYIANKLDIKKFSAIENKITIIWNYLIRRAETEFITKGLGTINSPYIINPEVRKWYEPIAEQLHDFYAKVGVNLTNTELFAMVSKEFGEWITKNICIPHNLEAGSCILAAIAVAREVA